MKNTHIINHEIVKDGFRNYVAIINGEKIEATRAYNRFLCELLMKDYISSLKLLKVL